MRLYDLPQNKANNVLGDKKFTIFLWDVSKVNSSLHWHDYYTIDIIAEGNGTKQTSTSNETVKKGYIQLVMPSDIHSLNAVSKCMMYTIRFSPDIFPLGFEKLLSCTDKFTTLTESNLKLVISFAEAMIQFGSNEKLCNNMLESILLILQSQLCIEKPAIPDNFKKVMEYLDVHFREDPPLEQAAKIGSYSAGYLSHLFKEITGYTYSQYLTSKKLNYACAIMQKKDLTLTDIAISSGFSSFDTFSRAFKQIFKKTPKEYRKEL